MATMICLNRQLDSLLIKQKELVNVETAKQQ